MSKPTSYPRLKSVPPPPHTGYPALSASLSGTAAGKATANFSVPYTAAVGLFKTVRCRAVPKTDCSACGNKRRGCASQECVSPPRTCTQRTAACVPGESAVCSWLEKFRGGEKRARGVPRPRRGAAEPMLHGPHRERWHVATSSALGHEGRHECAPPRQGTPEAARRVSANKVGSPLASSLLLHP